MPEPIRHAKRHDIANANDHEGDIYDALVGTVNALTAANVAVDTQTMGDAISAAVVGMSWQTNIIRFEAMVTNEPVAPSDDDRYISTETGTIPSTTQAVVTDDICQWDTATSLWIITSPEDGWAIIEDGVDPNIAWWYSGTQWRKLGTIVDHANLLNLNWSVAGHIMNTDLAMGTHKITGVVNPASAQDAATKNYVDTKDLLNVLLGGRAGGQIISGGDAFGTDELILKGKLTNTKGIWIKNGFIAVRRALTGSAPTAPFEVDNENDNLAFDISKDRVRIAAPETNFYAEGDIGGILIAKLNSSGELIFSAASSLIQLPTDGYIYLDGATQNVGLGYSVSGDVEYFGADLNLNTQKIKGLVDPTLAQEAATKKYVDDQVATVNEFTDLIDTPSAYAGKAGEFVVVNSTPDGLEFDDEPALGSDKSLYFDGATKTKGLKWNSTLSRFEFNADLDVTGDIDGATITAATAFVLGGDDKIRFNGPAGASWIEHNTSTGYMHLNNIVRFLNDVQISGDAEFGAHLEVTAGNFIYFDGATASKSLRWTGSQFEFVGGPLDMSSQKITSLAAPTPGTTDAATALYAESLGIGKGTSFPGTPSDGDLFNRTDLDKLYRYDSGRGKWLSEDRIVITFAKNAAGAAATQYLGRGDVVFNSTVGQNIPRNGTIISASTRTDRSAVGSGTRPFSIRVNDVAQKTFTLPDASGYNAQADNALNIDITALTDQIQSRVDGVGGGRSDSSIIVNLEIAWRA